MIKDNVLYQDKWFGVMSNEKYESIRNRIREAFKGLVFD
jgi:hypothetical protein